MDDYPTEGAVTNLVKDLRNRLKRSGVTEGMIQTVYGLGYRLKNDALEADETPSEPDPQPGSSPQSNPKSGFDHGARFQNSIQQRIGVLEDVIRALQAGGVTASKHSLAREGSPPPGGRFGNFWLRRGLGPGPTDRAPIAGRHPDGG